MKPKYRTEIQRFYERYPYYPVPQMERYELGIGAMCDKEFIRMIEVKKDSQKSHNV